jgi:hypothetical protein
MSADTPVIDLGYRPQSYFWPITHDTHVIAAIKGERRRNAIRNAFNADRVSPLDELFATPTLPDEHRLALGRLHRSFMGGEYLADRRCTTASATGPSTSKTATCPRRTLPPLETAAVARRSIRSSRRRSVQRSMAGIGRWNGTRGKTEVTPVHSPPWTTAGRPCRRNISIGSTGVNNGPILDSARHKLPLLLMGGALGRDLNLANPNQ